ncbi:MAG: Uma2 family endonuclease [Parvularculaceae bacterium]
MSRPFAMTADGLERHRFSVGDVDRMIEAGVINAEGRWELINGDIVPMAAQYLPHARMVARLFRQIDSAIDPKAHEVFLGATVELSPFSRVDPDIYVASASIDSRIVQAIDVLWAIEVSDATRRKDLTVKAALYATAGIPEYWVVDIEARVTHIHRGPSAGGWTAPIIEAPFDAAIAPAAFPDLNLTLALL